MSILLDSFITLVLRKSKYNKKNTWTILSHLFLKVEGKPENEDI